jgi:hypothetical protein
MLRACPANDRRDPGEGSSLVLSAELDRPLTRYYESEFLQVKIFGRE